jgi:hypothetical protein
MANTNGINWKMMAVIVGLIVAASGWVWNAAIIYSNVSANKEKLKEIYQAEVPKIETNKDDIIGLKKDIAQILSTQERMITTEENNTNAIIQAIARINNAN